jgi:hypothetical protein
MLVKPHGYKMVLSKIRVQTNQDVVKTLSDLFSRDPNLVSVSLIGSTDSVEVRRNVHGIETIQFLSLTEAQNRFQTEPDAE